MDPFHHDVIHERGVKSVYGIYCTQPSRLRPWASVQYMPYIPCAHECYNYYLSLSACMHTTIDLLMCILSFDMQIPKLREESRHKYLGKRRLDKLDELRDDIDDEEYIYSDKKYEYIVQTTHLTSSNLPPLTWNTTLCCIHWFYMYPVVWVDQRLFVECIQFTMHVEVIGRVELPSACAWNLLPGYNFPACIVFCLFLLTFTTAIIILSC